MKKWLMVLLMVSFLPTSSKSPELKQSTQPVAVANLNASILTNVIMADAAEELADTLTTTVWEPIKAVLGGPLGKAFALILIIGGVIAMAIGQLQWGLIAFVAGILLAAAPAIIDAIFG